MVGQSIVRLTLLVLLLAIPSGDNYADEALQERIELCTTCHGEAGLPEDKNVPIIWGQHFYYLYVQLRDYKAGRRANELMQGIVEDISKAEMKALAQHFSEQPWPNTGYRADAAKSAAGETAAGAGQCPQCHLGSYVGNSRVPRVSGQTLTYLERTMSEFKQRIRLNSPAKSSLFVSYSDADVAAMAEFLAGF